jgi:hypothetical protein
MEETGAQAHRQMLGDLDQDRELLIGQALWRSHGRNILGAHDSGGAGSGSTRASASSAMARAMVSAVKSGAAVSITAATTVGMGLGIAVAEDAIDLIAREGKLADRIGGHGFRFTSHHRGRTPFATRLVVATLPLVPRSTPN